MKNRLLGNKKKPERESTAVINFRTKELEVAPERIREVSLDYVSNLLENDVPDDDVKDDVTLTNTIHIVRKLRQHRNEDEETVNEEDIAEVFEKMKKKGSKYSFILKAGKNFMNCIGQLWTKT